MRKLPIVAAIALITAVMSYNANGPAATPSTDHIVLAGQPTAGGNGGNGGTPIKLTNSRDKTYIVTAPNMKPGDSIVRNVVLSNSGNSPLRLTLSQSDVAKTGSLDLASALDLVITDTTMSATLYSGRFDGVASVAVCGNGRIPNPPCREWTGGESHTISFSVSFPAGLGNEYQHTSVSSTFTWTAVGV